MDVASSLAESWRFACSVYRIEGVEDVCLALQDDLGYDVPLVLHGLWVGGERPWAGELRHGEAMAAGKLRLAPWHYAADPAAAKGSLLRERRHGLLRERRHGLLREHRHGGGS